MDCSRWQFSMFILGDQYYLRVELTCISRSLLCIMEDQLELSMNSLLSPSVIGWSQHLLQSSHQRCLLPVVVCRDSALPYLRSLANPGNQSTTGPRSPLESMAVFADSLLDSGTVLHGS
jgi:hypothetical protein